MFYVFFHFSSITTSLKSQVECIFLLPLLFWHLYASCWFSWEILSLMKSLPENFYFVSSWDLVPRFWHLSNIRLFFLATFKFYYHSEKSELFMRLEACKFSGTRSTPVSHKASQRLAFKTFSCISAGTGFSSIVSLLLFWEFVTELRSNWMILVNR